MTVRWMTVRKKQSFAFCLALTLAVLAAYANHFHNGFHFDDFHTVTENPFIRDLGNIPRFFTDATRFSTMPDHATWRPLVSASLALDYRMGHGLKPLYFHLSTFVWFLVQLILMYFLFLGIMDQADRHPSNPWTALLATACYGLHPAVAETVNYVIQRADLYCTLGVVASLLCFVAWPGQRKYGWYLLPAVAAYLSKAPALIYPFILLAYFWLFERDDGRPRSPAPLWPAFAVTLAMGILTLAMTPGTYRGGAASAWLYRITQPWIALHYLETFFLPAGLSADTDQGYVSPLGVRAVAGDVSVVVLVAVAFLCARRRQTRPIAFGILWFLLALLPTSVMPLAEVTNDHRMFFPFVGLALAVVWGLRLLLFGKAARRASQPAWVFGGCAAAVLALVGAAIGTRARNEVWRNEETLWRDVSIKSPGNGRGLMNYGLVFMGRGDYASAMRYFERALIYAPGYWALEDNLGIACGAQGREAEAEQHFRRAIALAPEDSNTHYYYGRWLESAARSAESAAQLETAVRLNPFAFDARDLLMQVYAGRKNWLALDRLAEETSQLAPGDATARRFLDERASRASELAAAEQAAREKRSPEAWLDLSLRYYQAGRYEDSIGASRKALELKPDYAEAYNNIAAADNAMRRWEEGIQAAIQAMRIRPGFELARNNLMYAIGQREKDAGHPMPAIPGR